MDVLGERSMNEPHNFGESLARSHAAEDLPFWREVYEAAFPSMVAMINHRRDGPHQRQGIDRSITLENSKQLLVDEKVRWRNKKTGKVYNDIALEYLSDERRGVPGWVAKPLLADYIAYAIAPLGRCYLLPVLQLQKVWEANKGEWLTRPKIAADNRYNGYEWRTLSVPVTVSELFAAIGACLRIQFVAVEGTE